MKFAMTCFRLRGTSVKVTQSITVIAIDLASSHKRPHAPLHSKRNRPVGVVAESSAISLHYQTRAPLPMHQILRRSPGASTPRDRLYTTSGGRFRRVDRMVPP